MASKKILSEVLCNEDSEDDLIPDSDTNESSERERPETIMIYDFRKCHVTSNKANSNLECAEDKFQTRGWVQGCEK
jgi:hypothetical protein